MLNRGALGSYQLHGLEEPSSLVAEGSVSCCETGLFFEIFLTKPRDDVLFGLEPLRFCCFLFFPRVAIMTYLEMISED